MSGLPITIILFAMVFISFAGVLSAREGASVPLPQPRMKSGMSIEEAIQSRRSVRTFRNEALTLADVSQILWAAQGVTGTQGEREYRAAPSAGALFGLETYLVAAGVEGLEPGVYRYQTKGHELVLLRKGDIRRELSASALGQASVREAAVTIVFAGVYARVAKRYGERARRYTIMEAGHASQNVYLQAEALGLGTVAVGAFSDEDMKRILNLPENEDPLYLMPIGKKE